MSKAHETKAVARRIDIHYPSRPSWFRWWRRWLVLLATIGALAWCTGILIGNFRHGKYDSLLNPAPVSLVHAHFENNCKVCHDSNGKGGFLKAVSDNACLNCHDAASHHPGADLNPGKEGVPHLTSLSNHQKAADCIVCHVEHRGKEANLGTDDRLCLQCHENLGAHGGGSSSVAKQIIAFDGKRHPAFGRALPTTMPGGGPLADSTWGKDRAFHFNHNTHLTRQDQEHGLPITNCSTCHTVEEAPSLPTGRRAYMRPVTYEQHCKTCHPIALPRSEGLPDEMKLGIPIIHDRLELIRGQVSNLSGEYLAILMKTPALREKLEGMPPSAWAKEQVDKLTDALEMKHKVTEERFPDWIDKLQKRYKAWNHPEMANFLESISDDLVVLVRKSPAAQAEYVIALLNEKTRCEKCHQVTGEPSVIYEKMLEIQVRSASPTTLPTRLQTVPTGIPQTPRRWFTHSEFAHTPHRDISCLTCHTNMDKDQDDGIARMPTMSSCVECHHPAKGDSRGASNTCISCHAFHDHSLERPPNGKLHPLAGVAPDK